jgi:hypothetical protein
MIRQINSVKKFDIVSIHNVEAHCNERQDVASIAEAAFRVLKSGGKFVGIAENHEEWTDIFRKAGFSTLRFVKFNSSDLVNQDEKLIDMINPCEVMFEALKE